MHVTEYEKAYQEWSSVKICLEQLDILLKQFDTSFQKKNGNYIRIDSYTYGDNDTFYEAHGSYSCLKTCNTWTNIMLKRAHIKTAIWTPWDWGIIKHFE